MVNKAPLARGGGGGNKQDRKRGDAGLLGERNWMEGHKNEIGSNIS